MLDKRSVSPYLNGVSCTDHQQGYRTCQPIDDLEQHAYKYWPPVLSQREQSTSIIPKLIESQDKFIGILYVADASPSAWRHVLLATEGMPGNLFLKHLVVLSDVGGEKLDRIRSDIPRFFPNGTMTFQWKETNHTYAFQSLATSREWTNDTLSIGGAGLVQPVPLSPLMEDVIMVLLHGGSSTDPDVQENVLEKCVIGSLIGQKLELDSFVRQRYIHVSRITGGAAANTMGQLCQAYVRERLQARQPAFDCSGHTIPGISQNAQGTDMSFDIVARSRSGKCCAIEVSFQVTTNSTIERKAGQAKRRQELLHQNGHNIAYVIDGAGNFKRRPAITTIDEFSDKTVSFKDEELDSLAAFLQSLDPGK